MKDYKELGASKKIDFEPIFKHQKNIKYTVAEVEAYSFPPIYSVGLAWNYIYNSLLKTSCE